MILDGIAWLDCFAFLLFLAPQLIVQVGLFQTALCGIRALPFLLIKLPYQLVKERFWTAKESRSPFVQHCIIFQDLVIRCVRYAFTKIPASIGKVFFSKWVALPFIKFRMLRHGILKSPIFWREIDQDGLKGLYIVHDVARRPDIIVYYCHGGGFSMGSSYFYMEFLMVWISLLKEAGYSNPAVFALEYTLVPQGTYPTQVQQTLAGYKYCLQIVEDSSRICVSGDSAGGTLVLSLMLCLSNYSSLKKQMPALAILISPWTTVISPKNQNTTSDYLSAESLDLYGKQYLGTKASSKDSLASPGQCEDLAWWKRASPSKGWFFIYGAEEVFAPGIEDTIGLIKKCGADVTKHEEAGWVHAWPVVKLFLCNDGRERRSGLQSIVDFTRQRLEPRKGL